MTANRRIAWIGAVLLAVLVAWVGRLLLSRPAPPPSPPKRDRPFEELATPKLRLFRFKSYSVAIRSEWPCGIVALRAKNEHEHFNNSPLPLADWEFFTFADDSGSGEIRTKLLNKHWEGLAASYAPDTVSVHAIAKDIGRPGVHLGMDYVLDIHEPRFTVTYSIANHSGRALKNVSAFIGLPGFPNHRQILWVRNATAQRAPTQPHQSFREEGVAEGRHYEILRQTTADDAVLEGTVAIAEQEGVYVLKSTYQPDDHVKRAHAIVINKPGYITCHFDARLKDIPDGATRQLLVKYALTRPAQ